MNNRDLCLRLAIIATASCLLTSALAQNPRPNGVEQRPGRAIEQLRKPPAAEATSQLTLLPGYQQGSDKRPDGSVWGRIWKKGGLNITYVRGPSLGQIVRTQDKGNYLKHWEQTVGGRLVRLAVTKTKQVVVSVPLDDKPGTANAANFGTKAETKEEAADMITMALSLIPAGPVKNIELRTIRSQ
jgi:hypothetical protein